MTRLLVLCWVALWVGATLVLSERRWFRRVPLTDRLRPFTTTGSIDPARAGVLSVSSLREVAAPLAALVGARASRLLGVSEELEVRLRRIHSPLDVASFRLRQVGWCAAAFGLALLVAVAFDAPGPLALLLLLGAPALAFLVVEQQVAAASRARQRRLFLELPVVSEQLGMLLSAGYSLGGALNRLAARGQGVCGQDLEVVCARIRQGLTEIEALREWCDLADVDALDRLVGILALNREAGDLGRLISDEARAIRADAQRETVEVIDRRAQQVWIPVTVATLVPGILFLAVPFIEAMRLFSSGG